ncbi:general secretion pathway protein GspA, partial [Thiorhodococcus mannitoliphagus]|nr:general secretion pathway protein GspA [Thiorhodococcus mannitoliphagus]
CTSAGNAALMSEPLQHTLCDHAAGNYRILVTLAAELLAVAAQHERPQLDEALFLEVVTPPPTARPRRAALSR